MPVGSISVEKEEDFIDVGVMKEDADLIMLTNPEVSHHSLQLMNAVSVSVTHRGLGLTVIDSCTLEEYFLQSPYTSITKTCATCEASADHVVRTPHVMLFDTRMLFFIGPLCQPDSPFLCDTDLPHVPGLSTQVPEASLFQSLHVSD